MNRNEKPQYALLKKAMTGRLTKEEQKSAIDSASANYYYSDAQKFDDHLKSEVVDEAMKYIRPGRVADLGYINGIWTQALLKKGVDSVDIVEGAREHAEQARRDFSSEPRVRVFETLFEDFQPKERYDTVLMSGVVKHVPDDKGLLVRVRDWLAPGGVVIASTPNCRSFHRRLGTYMGLETSPDHHNANDRDVFNVHLYDRYSWRELFIEAGYEVDFVKGLIFKFLSTEQLMYLSKKYDIEKMVKGMRCLGEELEDYAWYLILVARVGA